MKLFKKHPKGNWICIVIFMVALQVMFLWCLDISVSGMLSNGVTSNGFIDRVPLQTYHLGLYGSIINFLALAFITVHHILKED